MISVIIYGRNDSHGYNLPRRATISLNCIAEVLTDPDDEILFVDYNTPHNCPTFIESIDDTLTEKAKKLLKIFRVPPEIHLQYKEKTHLIVSEPLARNIALRRSNPNNRWILSTNSDMIFIPRKESLSLSDIVKNLDDGSYCTPRFELPESLWECLDRKEPKQNIQIINQWRKDFNLNFVLYRSPSILYDAPGDFQLMLRDQLFAIDGFDESMILGWHVDSNIAKRLFILNKETKPLIDDVYGYHCMHTRTLTDACKRGGKRNDLDKYVFSVENPYLPNQSTTWGLPEIEFETISASITKSKRNLDALKKITTPYGPEYYELTPQACFDNLTYPSEHVLPYISSILATCPKNATITYIGLNDSMCKAIGNLLSELGIQFFSLLGGQIAENHSALLHELYNKSNVFIFDFGHDINQNNIQYEFFYEIASILDNIASKSNENSKINLSNSKYFITINTSENLFSNLIELLIAFNYAPFSAFCVSGFSNKNINEKNVELRENELKKIKNYFIDLDKSFFYEHNQYQFGSTINFTLLHRYTKACLKNWSNISPKGIWSLGNTSTISLKLDKLPEQNLKLKILVKPFTRSFHPNQELKLLVNNIGIKTWSFKHRFFYFKRMRPNTWIEASIPSSIIATDNLKLSFNIKFPSKDSGFGIRMQKLILSEIK